MMTTSPALIEHNAYLLVPESLTASDADFRHDPVCPRNEDAMRRLAPPPGIEQT